MSARIKTKIIATLGPSSSAENILRRMMRCGLDVARLNFSHGTLGEHKERLETVRRLNARYRRRIRILGDLEGHRIRIGRFRDRRPIALKRNQVFWLMQQGTPAEAGAAAFDYDGPIRDIKKGHHIYIDDGLIALKVVGVFKKSVKTQVMVPGLLKERKGINVPLAHLRFHGLTPKDKADIDFAVSQKLDYIAQSFVRNARDVRLVADRIRGRWPACRIIAKIENRRGLADIDAIIDASDGIMIARGDLGVSLPIYEVPMIQKEIIRKCNRRNKFVITATQMLENMVDSRLPTRAEVTDVANAVLDGTDSVMLSAETAVGLYPVEAVDMMNKIIKFTEASKNKI